MYSKIWEELLWMLLIRELLQALVYFFLPEQLYETEGIIWICGK